MSKIRHKIYLDINIYNRPFDDQAKVRIRLETIAINPLRFVEEMEVIQNG